VKIYLDAPLPEAETVTLEGGFWEHYLTNVRRLGEGDELDVAGTDRVGSGELVGTDPLTVRVHRTRPARRPVHRLWIVQALTRKKKFEETVRRGAELGVTDFLPVISEHTVRRPNRPDHQRDRWRRIALDATRITKRDWLPTVHELTDFEASFETLEEIRLLFGDEGGNAPGEAFDEEKGESTAIFVGPEGGFTDEEKHRLRVAGASAVSLGDANYRSETASLALAVLWLHRHGPPA